MLTPDYLIEEYADQAFALYGGDSSPYSEEVCSVAVVYVDGKYHVVEGEGEFSVNIPVEGQYVQVATFPSLSSCKAFIADCLKVTSSSLKRGS